MDERLLAAWAARDMFVAEWAGRIPTVERDAVRTYRESDGEGLSAVGKMRQAMGGKTDSMSRDYRPLDGKGQESWEQQANKAFDNFVDEQKRKWGGKGGGKR